MSLQFWIGGAGSGKSVAGIRRCIEEETRRNQEEGAKLSSGRGCFLLVPEQFTLQTQSELLDLHPRHGTMDIDVLSFPRLALRVYEELGLPMPVLLDDLGKTLLLRKLAADHVSELVLFGRNMDKPGFLDECKSILSEFFQYRVDTETIASWEADAKNRPMFAAKCHDLKVLLELFRQGLEKNEIPEEELLCDFARHIPESEWLKESLIVLDGFTGFTPCQMEVLGGLLRTAKEVIVTLTVGSGRKMADIRGEEDLFALSRATYDQVGELAEKNGVTILPDRYLTPEGEVPYRFRKSEELARLERAFDTAKAQKAAGTDGKAQKEDGTRRPSKNGEPDVSLHICRSPEDEISFVAGQIRSLVQSGRYRYKDLAVVLGDPESMQDEVEKIFARCRIPAFLDESRPLRENPLPVLILNALEILEKQFPYEEMFGYLKSGFAPVSEEECDELENVVLAAGYRGRKAWQKKWDITPELAEARDRAVKPLLELSEAVKAGGRTGKSWLMALRDFLTTLDCSTTLEEWSRSFAEAGNFVREKEYAQSMRLTEELFVRLEGILGEETFSAGEMRKTLETGFSEIKAGVIPASLDQVVVGDMVRTRLQDIKVLFLVGMNEGVIPKTPSEGGILSDLDREWLKSRGARLAPSGRDNAFIQKLYLYLVMTKPSERLVMTCAQAGADQETMTPSGYLELIRRAIGELPWIDESNRTSQTLCEGDVLEWIGDGLRDYALEGKTGEWIRPYLWAKERKDLDTRLGKMLGSAFSYYEPETIGSRSMALLTGERLQGSVTQLEHYASCPFAWFITDALRLKERKLYSFEAKDMGTLFHEALELFFRQMHREHLKWTDLGEEKQQEMAGKAVEETMLSDAAGVLWDSARTRYQKERLTRMISRTIWALVEQGKKGDFLPEGVEMRFSSENAEAMRILLEEDKSIHMRGKIDRVDTMQAGNDLYLRVIDYKSGSKKLDFTEIMEGLQLQLVLYLDAAMEVEEKRHPGKNIRPAGIFYYHIEDPIVETGLGERPEEVDKMILKELSLEGLASRNLTALLGMDRDLAEEGKSSVIPVTMKDGVPAKKNTAGENELRSLCTEVRRIVKRLGKGIMDGEVALAPYRRGNKTSCDYCSAKSICGFDATREDYHYRHLRTADKNEVLARLAEADQKAADKAREMIGKEGPHGE